MEKKAQLYEIIIKLVMAIVSFIAAVFVVKNMIFMFPLFKSINKSEYELLTLVYNTPIGEIVKDIGIIDRIDLTIILKGFAAFLLNVEWICIIFMILMICLLIIYFIFLKWKLVRNYSLLTILIVFIYVFKYLLFLLSFALIYKNGEKTLAISFVVGNSFFLIFSAIELFCLCLFIVKFILNIVNDIKYYLES